jgi:hypothetical protein
MSDEGPGNVPDPPAEGVARPQYGWSLLALHEHIVSRLSVSAMNSTASGASPAGVAVSHLPTSRQGKPDASERLADAVSSVAGLRV